MGVSPRDRGGRDAFLLLREARGAGLAAPREGRLTLGALGGRWALPGHAEPSHLLTP